jgi:hypothetical protein
MTVRELVLALMKLENNGYEDTPVETDEEIEVETVTVRYEGTSFQVVQLAGKDS